MRYLVSADHVSPSHACTDRPAKVGSTDYGNGEQFYATVEGYGQSKLYSSPEAAIRGMLAEHACTNIRITEAA